MLWSFIFNEVEFPSPIKDVFRLVWFKLIQSEADFYSRQYISTMLQLPKRAWSFICTT